MKVELFSRDAYNNILVWSIRTVDKHTSYSLAISHGRLDGEKSLSWEHDIVGVNIGKANETTPQEQAISRLESRVNRKKRRGYKELVDDHLVELRNLSVEKQIELLREVLPETNTDKDGHLKPMRAQQYFRKKPNWTAPDGTVWKDRKYYYLKNPYVEKEKGAVVPKFPVLGQPKINGVRATIGIENDKIFIRSKDGLEYTDNLPHIVEWAKRVFSDLEDDSDVIFDGELYIYGELLQNIQSAVKKVNLNTPRVIFVIFDLAIPETGNKERWNILKECNADGMFMHPAVELIKTYIIKSDAQAQMMCDKFIQQGHEGIILRSYDAPYYFGGRRINMVKLKRTISEDFKIVDIIPQPKEKTRALFVCEHKGNRFKVTPMFDHGTQEEILIHRQVYIGKLLQCTFYEWTDKDVPYHVMETTIRDYE